MWYHIKPPVLIECRSNLRKLSIHSFLSTTSSALIATRLQRRSQESCPHIPSLSFSVSLCPLCQVLTEAEHTPLRESSRNLTYDLLCALADPSREDTRGLSHLAQVAERFAFSLLVGSQCDMWVPNVSLFAIDWLQRFNSSNLFPLFRVWFFQKGRRPWNLSTHVHLRLPVVPHADQRPEIQGPWWRLLPAARHPAGRAGAADSWLSQPQQDPADGAQSW